MARLRVHNLTVSLDGYAAGPDQGPDQPLGRGGERFAMAVGNLIGAAIYPPGL